jgi:HEAT repeat protein
VIPITGPRSLLLLALSAVLWSVGCGPDGRAAAKAPRGARKAPVESVAERLKEIDHIGPTAAKDRAARANLGRSLYDPRKPVRDQAGYWLSKAGAEAVPILVTALEDTSTEISAAAAYALGLMGEAAAPAVPALTRRLGGDIDTLANMSDWALSQVGPRGKGGFIPFLRDLRYGNAFDRAGAARQFSLYGDASAVAIPLLARMLEDPDPIAAQAAADALVRIGPRASLAVQAMLNSPKPTARLRALLVLSQMRTSYF